MVVNNVHLAATDSDDHSDSSINNDD